ncbi:hypothetical protein BGZ99_001024 [Dissophora globulifera]|uniref:Uncharacterized protein n=1 Tax=Dissophora globulifera TaxID=979702 RepID=A0A9P6QZT1_9FUNG|nr:hypothetical protein BGZ99_001024 [Dissophora globulifera]
MVSHNDYNRNIYSLGPFTNYSIASLYRSTISVGLCQSTCPIANQETFTQDYFANAQNQEIFDRACPLSVIGEFHKHPSIVIAQEYEDCLAKRGVEGLKTQLIVDRGILNSKHMKYKGLPAEIAMRDKVLEILTKL